MTGPRRRSEAQEAILRAVAIAAADEKAARAVAEAEARLEIERKVQTARDITTALIYKAHHEHGVTKSAITTQALGTTNFNAVKQRLDEYVTRMGLIPGESVVDVPNLPESAATAVVPGLHVTTGEGGSVRVKFTNYTHPDLGAELSGVAVFPHGIEGSPILEDANEALSASADDPFWVFRLRDIDTVQEATR